MAEMDFPTDPTNGQVWNDLNGVDWTYADDGGWSRAPVQGGINDPNVFGGQSAGSINLGQESTIMTGINNTILGHTGDVMQTGANNVLVGEDAAETLAQANNNVIIGQDAAKAMNNSFAHDNVIIGQGALGSNTSAINCVVIGRGARPQSNGDQNSIAIGHNAIGIGPNTVVIGDDNIITTELKGTVTAKEIFVSEILETPVYTLATLPAANQVGQIIFVSDSVAVAGGVHCSSNGTNWVIMGTATPIT